jgi:hypothetical protein
VGNRLGEVCSSEDVDSRYALVDICVLLEYSSYATVENRSIDGRHISVVGSIRSYIVERRSYVSWCQTNTPHPEQ